MKHYEPGKPYPQKKTDRGQQTVYHSSAADDRRAARRRQVRRNRIVFAALVLVLLLLIIAAVSLSHGGSAASEAVSRAESLPEPTAAPTPTPTPTPEPESPFVPAWDATGEEGFPYLIAVNRTTQTVTVYEKGEQGDYTEPYTSMICSTGRDTPEGKFHTSDQYTWRALVGGVYGQYATRICTDILFHSVPYYGQDKARLESEEYNKLGTPASLGCVRMKVEDCKWIYEECPSGTPVVIFDGGEELDPLGNPGFEPIDLNSPNAGWDPTDPDPANPWNA